MDKRVLQFHLDFDYLKNISIIGVRRAAAFSAIALNSTKDVAQQSLVLSSDSMWRFFPEPAPKELVVNSVNEFRSWIIGNALRELDAGFNQFLDLAWAFHEWAKLHGKQVNSNHKVGTIDSKTNVGTKMNDLLRALGEKNPDTGKLWSLSNLRNCLTHARGVVTERHKNDEGGLKIMWLGLDAGFQLGDQFVPIPHPIPEGGIHAPNLGEPEVVVAVKIVERQKIFPLGSAISIEPTELHEICHYYLTSTDRVMESLKRAIADLGVPAIEELPAPEVQA